MSYVTSIKLSIIFSLFSNILPGSEGFKMAPSNSHHQKHYNVFPFEDLEKNVARFITASKPTFFQRSYVVPPLHAKRAATNHADSFNRDRKNYSAPKLSSHVVNYNVNNVTRPVVFITEDKNVNKSLDMNSKGPLVKNDVRSSDPVKNVVPPNASLKVENDMRSSDPVKNVVPPNASLKKPFVPSVRYNPDHYLSTKNLALNYAIRPSSKLRHIMDQSHFDTQEALRNVKMSSILKDSTVKRNVFRNENNKHNLASYSSRRFSDDVESHVPTMSKEANNFEPTSIKNKTFIRSEPTEEQNSQVETKPISSKPHQNESNTLETLKDKIKLISKDNTAKQSLSQRFVIIPSIKVNTNKSFKQQIYQNIPSNVLSFKKKGTFLRSSSEQQKPDQDNIKEIETFIKNRNELNLHEKINSEDPSVNNYDDSSNQESFEDNQNVPNDKSDDTSDNSYNSGINSNNNLNNIISKNGINANSNSAKNIESISDQKIAINDENIYDNDNNDNDNNKIYSYPSIYSQEQFKDPSQTLIPVSFTLSNLTPSEELVSMMQTEHESTTDVNLRQLSSTSNKNIIKSPKIPITSEIPEIITQNIINDYDTESAFYSHSSSSEEENPEQRELITKPSDELYLITENRPLERYQRQNRERDYSQQTWSIQNNCINARDGYYPDIHSNCNMFFVCYGGRKAIFNCPPGTKFSRRHHVCVWPSSMTCGE